MSSSPTIEPFNGINGEECNGFIRSIRAAAWKEGKLRDLAWMADFASLHFSHQALLWHSQLPQDVRQDWAKLEVELLNQWAPPKYGDDPRNEPTPAAAPSLSRDDRADRSLQGVLKVVVDGSNSNYYLKDNEDRGLCVLTDDENEAVRLRCNSLSNTALLELSHGPRHSWLAVHWDTSKSRPNFTKGSTEYGVLFLMDTLNLKTNYRANTPCQLALWTVSADGELIPVWENDDTKRIPLGGFCRVGSDELLYLASDSAAYSRQNPDKKRVKFFIQQTD